MPVACPTPGLACLLLILTSIGYLAERPSPPAVGKTSTCAVVSADSPHRPARDKHHQGPAQLDAPYHQLPRPQHPPTTPYAWHSSHHHLQGREPPHQSTPHQPPGEQTQPQPHCTPARENVPLAYCEPAPATTRSHLECHRPE